MNEDTDETRELIPFAREFSHYRILSKIGGGGQGQVYLAEHTKLKCEVALKFLGEQFLNDPIARNRFVREAQAAAALNHPRIVTIHDVNEYRGRPFISMECVKGRPLSDVIKDKQLDIAEAIDVAIQICDGLQAAHEKGLVHRDIKPGNIMIDDNRQVKILDFGIAKELGSAPKTLPDGTLGTPSYMSPEILQGREFDQKADLFSFGVMLYEMISGQRPFGGDYFAAVIYSIINETPPPLSSLINGLPVGFEEIINRLLEKDPQKRYQNAAEVSEDLKKIVVDHTGGTFGDILRWYHRHRKTVRVASLLMLLSAASIVIYVDGCPPRPGYTKLAVLPFENLGLPADEYFADGVSDAITVHLARNHQLGVINRESCMPYKKTRKSTRQIGEELEARYLLNGTIYWEKEPGNRLRINAKLVRVADDVNVWAESYDRDLENLFDLQQEVASAVANALDLVLVFDSNASSTTNLAAYDFYLRGNAYFRASWNRTDIEIAADFYRKAVERDSTFSDAYSMLARCESSLFWEYYDRSEQRCKNAFAAANRSLQLRPDLPTGYEALGYCYYHCDLDYSRALELFEQGLQLDPNNSELIYAVAAVHRRQGDVEKAKDEYIKALELDPRSHLKTLDLALTYAMMDQFVESEKYAEQAARLVPDDAFIQVFRTWLPIIHNGDVNAARQVFEKASTMTDLTRSKFYYWLLRFLYPDSNYTGIKITAASDTVAYLLFLSQANRLQHNEPLERVYADSARVILERKITERPDDAQFLSSLGLAWAGLRDKQKSLNNANRALELLPTSRDAFDAPFLILNLAEVMVIFEQYEDAIKLLGELQKSTGLMSPAFFKIDPLWKPLHNHPGFQRLLKSGDHSES